MNKKHLKTIELDKILDRLSAMCYCDSAKQAALELVPICNLSEAEYQLKQTEDAYILVARFGSPSFYGIKTIDNSLARAAAGGLLTMGELLEIAGALRSVRAVLDWRSRSAGLETTLDGLFGGLFANKYLEEKIFSCILSEEEMADNASGELFSIRRKIASAANRIREKLDSMIRSSTVQKYLQDAVVTQRDGRFVVPVKTEYRGEVAGLVHDTSSSGATVFVEPMAVVEANNEIKILKSKESDEIERILYEFSAETASFAESIKASCEIMASLDLIFAKARIAFDMKASVPLLNSNGIIDIKKARHPLLNSKNVVPVDIRLGEGYNCLVITGPNTGGKTVTLKTTGLLTLMAMCGMMIPAGDNSRVSVFSNVLVDIGDEQSIEQSLSTFSSHMKNIISIMNIADSNSLILLDELCSGTDPVEGAALAVAILERLRSFGATICATTHYSELKEYALDTPNVENACCEFDVQTLSPTYKLLIGVPGRSNAFAISSGLGMDTEVIDSAKLFVSQENTRFESVVEKLEGARAELEKQKQTAYDERRRADEALKQAQQLSDKLKSDYDREIEQAKSMARIITDNARIEVNRLLDEIDAIKKEKKGDSAKASAVARAAFKKLDDISSGGEKYDDGYTLERELVAGDNVLIDDGKTKAIVLKPTDSRGKVTVQAGIMKIKVDISDIRFDKSSSPEKKKNYSAYTSKIEEKASRRGSMELDLRGYNADEGIMELDRFIDNCMINKIGQFTVIHGKGTGVLRAAVQKFLRSNKYVRTFRLGVFGEGESGVTIVELK